MSENKQEQTVETERSETIEATDQDCNKAEMNAEATEKEELENEETTAEQTQNDTEQQLAKLQAQLAQEEDRRLRLLADFENYKRRANLDKEAIEKYRSQNVLTNLLPVLDNFERALVMETKTEEAQSILTGMEMIYRNLCDALQAEGLSEIPAHEQEFDPNYHQAVMTGSEEDKPAGIVLEVLQKGYMLKDRVLRPAMVKVNE